MAMEARGADFGGGEDVRFEHLGAAGIITLTRPNALNALNHRMVKAISAALGAWERNANVALVVIKGEGRAFSAGGDLMAIYNGRANPPVEFFADEYRLNVQIEKFRKPYIALIDGIVMGGGVGLSFHGSHRVMTENAQFAMPEVGIGFFPDVGGSHLLPDLADNFGMYLGLTGTRIKWGDALWSGLATHPVKSEHLGALLEMLARNGEAEGVLRNFFTMPPRETPREIWEKIDGWFGEPTLDAIFAALEKNAGDAEADKILATLRTKSPTSLRVTFQEIARGLSHSMEECMRMEFRIVNRMLAGHDFYEGIRAAIVDKGATPVWDPASIKQVSQADADAYFAPLPGGDLTF
ncbi:MAG: enoyl-CoA hydratase/isomerase family protein [Rhizobiaceae bacterium]|nr:enoyl-CoA hydratase/isomerase family protein [Rhizobiaceae bacterium]